MSECPRCGEDRKDLPSHTKRMHPEASFMRPDDERPHPQAYKMTIEHEPCEMDWHDMVTDGWVTERYGWRQHGWFIPVDVPDNTALTELNAPDSART